MINQDVGGEGDIQLSSICMKDFFFHVKFHMFSMKIEQLSGKKLVTMFTFVELSIGDANLLEDHSL